MNNQFWLWWAVALTSVAFLGCMEAVRRPAAGESPKWDAPPQQAASIPADSTAVTAALETTAVQPAADVVAPATVKVYAKRNRNQRQRIKQVNEYALWCIENRMWQEARRHLEQAVQGDSLAASLHNNLGIVYEQLGLEEEARKAYKDAQRLNPQREAYQTNLLLLEKRYAHFDKSATAASSGDSTRKSPDHDTDQVLPDERQGLGATP